MRDMVLDGLALDLGFALDRSKSDGDVAQRPRFTLSARCLTRGKGEHIGRLVLAAVGEVELADRAIVDLSVGVGTRTGSFDLSLLVKNALDDDTYVSQTWNSYGPAFPRWYGVVFSGKL